MTSASNDSADKPTIVFTGGGTGGHIYPGIAVAQRVRALLGSSGRSVRMVWLGSFKESDRSPVEAAGIEYRALPSGKLRRQISAENIADAFRVLAGYFAARRALKELKPILVFSKGGYVSVPPCRAAASLGIPVFTHESDLSPGLATRLNARIAERVFVSYEETRARFPEALRSRVEVSGQPVRSSLSQGDAGRGRAFAGIPEGLPVILVIGGSQGARKLNELLSGALPELLASYAVVHQTGPGNPGRPESSIPEALRPRYRAFEYIRDEIADLYAAASLYVGRAGAGSLWECAVTGVPMVLVPLAGTGTRGDQVENARYFASRKAALVLEGRDAEDPAALVKACRSILDDGGRRAEASQAARDVGEKDGANYIALRILKRMDGKAAP